MAGLGLGVAGVAFLLKNAFMDAVKGAIEEQRQIRVLTGLLETRFPKSAQVFVDAVNSQIDSLEALGFADSEVRDSFEISTRFTSKASEAIAIQSAAADLARAKGISLAEATMLIGKAMKGQTKGLKDLGINLKKGAKLTTILAAISAKYGTAAEDFTDTIEGRALVAQIKFNDAMETAGNALLPAVSTVLEELTPYLEKFSSWVTENSPEIEAFFKNLVKIMTEEVGPKVKEFAKTIITSFEENYPKLEEFFKDKGALLAVALFTAFTGKLSFGLTAGLISMGVDPMVAGALGILGNVLGVALLTKLGQVILSRIGLVFGSGFVARVGTSLGTAVTTAMGSGFVARIGLALSTAFATAATAVAGMSGLAILGSAIAAALGAIIGVKIIDEIIKNATKPVNSIPLQPEFDAPNIFDIIESIFFPRTPPAGAGAGAGPAPTVTVDVTLDGDKIADKVTIRLGNRFTTDPGARVVK
jgi:hypothetical protein